MACAARPVRSRCSPSTTFGRRADRADFHPAVIEAETFDGQVYAIMFQTGMRGLMYRPSVLKAVGLNEFPKTFDDFMADGEALEGERA